MAKNKSDTSADELLKWHQLKEDGVISDEEFKKKKLEILG
ncbi:SHOCT domain-containing protein [Photobacterium carnosum]|nr:SHOCT domain-containing protein [Photobacterium carnosum]MCD9539597.1 SHOCT domain-containing protein [Photobacterium carnosum]MCD9540536.1 SHOCT domain-containing protein [Photobacterium carnosum]MCF2164026.1 SHOCT domain-containing protein [Photobacterium carnosum]